MTEDVAVKKYVVCAAHGSTCPRCHAEPRLLAPDETWERVLDFRPVPESANADLAALYKLRDF